MLTKNQIKYLAERYLIEVNGCGPDDWRGGLVPDRAWWLFGARLTPACNTHDLLYGLGGTEADRRTADKRFRGDIRACSLRHPLVRLMRWRPSVKLRIALTAAAYYKGVKEKGKDHFDYHDLDGWQDILMEEGIV